MKKGLSQPVLIALIVAGFLVLAGGGWFTLIRPQHAKAADIDHQIADTNSAIDAARALTLEAKKGAQIRVADLYRLTKAMPDQVDMAGILLELNQVAEDSGITFDLINPSSTATPISGYLAIPITVEFTGNFYDLSDFLYRIRNLVDVRHGTLDATGRLFAMDEVDFAEAPPPQGFPQIRAHLVIDAFVYGTGTAPTVAPPAGTTGATGATGVTRPDPDPGPRRSRGERVGCSGRDLGMAKKIDPKAKAKRQKIYAGVGGVILLAVLAFQVPRTLKMMHPSTETSSSPAPATTTSATPTPISAPSLAGGNAAASTAAAAPGGDGISDPDAIPAAESGQLLAFGLFRSKDPFVQQLNLNGATGATGVVPTSAGATGPTGPATGSALGVSQPSGQPVSASTAPKAAATTRSDLGERRSRVRQGGRHLPRREAVFQAHLGDEDGREDLDRRRLARERRADGHADEEQGADPDEHRRRHALRAAAGLGLLASAHNPKCEKGALGRCDWPGPCRGRRVSHLATSWAYWVGGAMLVPLTLLVLGRTAEQTDSTHFGDPGSGPWTGP